MANEFGRSRDDVQKDWLKINIYSPVHYHMSGKFECPDESWQHLQRVLLDFELIVIERGTLYIEDEWGQYEVKEGEYLLMNPSQIQQGYKSSFCCFYWLHFWCSSEMDYECIKTSQDNVRFEHHFVQIPKQGKLVSKDRVMVLMKQLQDSDKRYMNFEENTYLATAILCEIQNQIFSTINGRASEDSRIDNDIIDYVATHISEQIKVKDIADSIGYNDKYLTTYFHKKHKITLKKYITDAKMERAKYLISNTRATISEIAFDSGYYNVQAFSSAFRKQNGLTPSEFRNAYTKEKIESK